MVRSEVQSKKGKKIVVRLVYQTRGPYVIISKASLGTYNCRKYGNPESTVKKFRAEDLHLLPPAVYPCEQANTADLWYLNSDFAPLHHLFTKTFDIEAYNTRWFDTDPSTALHKFPNEPEKNTALPLCDSSAVPKSWSIISNRCRASRAFAYSSSQAFS